MAYWRFGLIALAQASLLAACGNQEQPQHDGESVEAGPAIETPPPPLTPTEHTIRANNAVGARLPLDDQRAFEAATRGRIAMIEGDVITDAAGNVIWDRRAFDFVEGAAPDSVNPTLWRHAKLRAIDGLFEIADGLYQVRGYDAAVMTVIKGETGWVLIDPLLAVETASATMALVNQTLGERPISAVLVTHSHADHYGGIRGVLTEQEITEQSVPIITPEGFSEEAIEEIQFGAGAMTRRSFYQFGSYLPASPVGRIASSLAPGTVSFVPSTEIIKETGERRIIDGVDVEFIMASGTEAPAEYMLYLHDFQILHTAELATQTMHNILTPRGAEVRDALAWSKAIDLALNLYRDNVKVMIAAHDWPVWGSENVITHLENKRDLYRYMHDQTLRLANQGLTINEIAEEIGEPDFMSEDLSTRGYYGSMNFNSKAVYQRYFGWFDANPANFNPHPPEEAARRYVALAGGADQMLAHAVKAFDEGDYRWCATILNHLVFAEPENETARAFLASAYEQLGFQAESTSWRYFYLSAASDLRRTNENLSRRPKPNADFVRAVPTADFFNILATNANPAKLRKDYILNFNFPDTQEQIVVTMRDGIASHRYGIQLDKADVSIRLNRTDLDDIMLGVSSFPEKLGNGSIAVDGDPAIFAAFLQGHDTPNREFNIVEP